MNRGAGRITVGVTGALLAGGAMLFPGVAAHAADGAAEKANGGPFAVPEMVVNDTLGIRDRCTSCHTGIRDPGMAGRGQPAAAHPGGFLVDHRVERFGCTPCHGGDGTATSADRAHGAVGGGKPMAVGRRVEMACARCHADALHLDGAPFLSLGRRSIDRYGCVGCHRIGGFAWREGKAPDLNGFASRSNAEWVYTWLGDPKVYAENARMPRYEIDDKARDALTGYLMTFTEESPFDTTAFPAEGDFDNGKRLFRLSFCISCHTVDGKGADEAIDLGRVGNKWNRASLLRMISDTRSLAPDSPMPQYTFTNAQVADLAAYMMDELYDPYFADPEEDSTLANLGNSWPSEEERVDAGRRLFKELRCANCHSFPGGEEWIRVGPDLREMTGDLLVSLGRNEGIDFPWSLEEYVWRKVNDPRGMEPAEYRYKMPSYDLDERTALGISMAVLAQMIDDEPTAAFLVHDREMDPLELEGEFGELVSRYRCTSCHSFSGVGHNTTYDLGMEGSRVQRKWLRDYLQMPYTIRPILTIRMPFFNITDEQAEVLADGIMRTRRDVLVEGEGDFRQSPARIAAGKRLFDESGCLACHQMGSKGGYVGPSFTAGSPVGRKLTPGWIVRWLDDPAAIKPEVPEPRYGFTLEQRRSIASYLMSIR